MNRNNEPSYPGFMMFGRGDCRRSPHSSASIDTGTGRPDGKRSERTGEPARFDPQTISRWRRRGKKEGERSEDGIPSIGKSPNHEQSGMQRDGCNRGNGGRYGKPLLFFSGAQSATASALVAAFAAGLSVEFGQFPAEDEHDVLSHRPVDRTIHFDPLGSEPRQRFAADAPRHHRIDRTPSKGFRRFAHAVNVAEIAVPDFLNAFCFRIHNDKAGSRTKKAENHAGEPLRFFRGKTDDHAGFSILVYK